MQTRIDLYPDYFPAKEVQVAERGELKASSFCFPSGVQALRLSNSLGELIMLPFQGQQIWDAVMNDRRLTMKSMFDQPYPTRDFLSTYGGFLLHCGAVAMGVPGPEDTHPLHGELHNAPYETAGLIFGVDERGEYIGLTGHYQHTVAFNYNYAAVPMVKLHAGSSVFSVSMSIQNLKATPMPLMFLEHINFKPVDGGRLVQTVPVDPGHMYVRAEIPAFMEVSPGYRKFVEEVKKDPAQHLEFTPGQSYDPEMVLFLKYQAGEDGWARTLQGHPDGTADIVRHRPDQLDHCVRWICRTPDQDAIGVEPCTAEVEGFSAEKAKGNVRSLPGGESFQSDLEIGTLSEEDVSHEISVVNRVLAAV